MVHGPGTVEPRRYLARGAKAARPSRFQLGQSEPAALAARCVRRQPAGAPRRERRRLSLPRQLDPGGGQAQSAERGADGASARALAEVRSGAAGADEGRAGADRRDAGAVEGRVRAGEQELGVKLTTPRPTCRTPSPRGGEGWGEGARPPRLISNAE